jgi:hypothetical protein
MTKLNTYSIYDLAVRVHILLQITHTEEMKLGEVYWPLLQAKIVLQSFSETESIFSPSLKRAIGVLLRSLHSCGVPERFPWEDGGQYAYSGAT